MYNRDISRLSFTLEYYSFKNYETTFLAEEVVYAEQLLSCFDILKKKPTIPFQKQQRCYHNSLRKFKRAKDYYR